ncbi:MAG: sigma-70 family RNA polymerase sigma factor [Acidobacteriota bacterium]
MHNVYFIPSRFKILYIAERPGSRFPRLKDDDIRAIRESLIKTTRNRIRDHNDVEDIVQETLLTMITSMPDGELKKGMLAWSRGILRNKVGNFYRKAERHASATDQYCSPADQDRVAASNATQEIALSNKELQFIIKEKIADFPPDVRRVLELMVAGLNPGEIVDRMHPEPYQTVISRLYRGRKKLARELIKCGFVPRGRGMRELKKSAKDSRTGSSKAS